MASRPFSCALVTKDESTFDESHVREDLTIFNLTISEDEGDFAKLSIEVANPRVGLLASGRPRWVWVAWNPNFEFDASSDDYAFSDIVPLFFGRIIGVPADLTGPTVTLEFLARPDDFVAQKEALAETLRQAPYWSGIWYSPDTRFDPDNVLESRAALWHADRVTGVVTISSITNGEDGTIAVDGGIALADSVGVTYGDPPCREVNVTATISWDQKIKRNYPLMFGNATLIRTYTGQGLIDNWPKPGANIGGGWSIVAANAYRADNRGPDVWTYADKTEKFGLAQYGTLVTCPEWAEEMTNMFTTFPAHVFSIKEWLVSGNIVLGLDVSRSKTEQVSFTLRSDTQSILTDSTDGEAVSLTFSSSEVAFPLDPNVGSSESFEIPLGKPSARAFITTDAGKPALEYLLMVARAKLIASARCVDVSLEIPWDFAIAQGVSCRKNLVLTDPDLPGGIAGGKIRRYELSADGDSGVFTCNVTIGCSIGRGGTITAVAGEPDYVDDDYVEEDYQTRTGEFIMPVSGEVAYSPILGQPCIDDGIDLETAPLSQMMREGFFVDNTSSEQPIPEKAKEPSEIYAAVNAVPTRVSFEMKPLNSGPFFTAHVVQTSLLKIAKTIDLEAEADSSS